MGRSLRWLPFALACTVVALLGPLSASAGAVSDVALRLGTLTITDRSKVIGPTQDLRVQQVSPTEVEISDPARLQVSSGLQPDGSVRSLAGACGAPGVRQTVTCIGKVTAVSIRMGPGDDHAIVDVKTASASAGSGGIPDGASNTLLLGEAKPGPVIVDGGAGNDTLEGGGGPETLLGGPGVDTLRGNGGDDDLDAGVRSLTGTLQVPVLAAQAPAGTEVLEGGAGNDRLRGADGNDILRGGEGTDLLSGEGGNDVLDGGPQNDGMQGGTGVDTVDYSSRAEAIDVTIGDIDTSQPPPDTFDGLGHTPRIRAAQNGGTLLVRGFVRRNDGSSLDDSPEHNGNRDAVAPDIERVIGGSGNDRLAGNEGDNELVGGPGDDTLDGGGGADSLDGADGADQLLARDGTVDTSLACGPGTDTLVADPNDPAGTDCEPPTTDTSTPGTPPPLPRAAAPVLEVVSGTARLTSAGVSAVRIRCSAASTRCNGRLRIVVPATVRAKVGKRTLTLNKGRVLLDRPISIWRERVSILAFGTSGKVRALIGRLGKLRVRVLVDAHDEAFPLDRADTGHATRDVTLLRAKARKKKK